MIYATKQVKNPNRSRTALYLIPTNPQASYALPILMRSNGANQIMNTNKKTKQSGFTLIELMIVVGIIGVLSAIAIPAYKSYLIKTESNTAVSIPRTLLTNIDLYIQEKGSFPETTEASEVGAASDMSAMGTLALTKNATTPTNGTLVFTVNNADASIKDKKITYTRTNSGWKCTHDIPEALLEKDLKGCLRTIP
ncbi:pilin [Vibrio anguillarum]|nr:prepilin-type cleavage/methylation domain-containing protein [Vibrio anguillarum]MBF4250454.1 pilin [Vibrio anguillarum]MBF4387445.1 pilin [Vibrio anguillarum]MBF4404431.1 pilin [Vibrio anguillarum]